MQRFPLIRSTPIVLGLCCGIGLANNAAAQNTSLFGDRGPISQAQSRSLNTQLQGAASQTGGGQRALGAAAGTQSSRTGLAPANTASNTGFVGRDDDTGRFVGRQAAGQQVPTSGSQFRGAQFGGSRSAAGRRTGGGTAGDSAAQERIVRPRYRVGFSYSTRPSSSLRESLQRRFEQLAARRSTFRGISIDVSPQGVARLQGTVESESARKLVENLVRLEPGVRSVRNELTVPTTATETQE